MKFLRSLKKLRFFLPTLAAALIFAAPMQAADFVRMDANDDGAVNIGDTIFILGYISNLENTPACLSALDCDDNGVVNIVDVVYQLEFIFGTTVTANAPYPSCGADPTPDSLACGFGMCP